MVKSFEQFKNNVSLYNFKIKKNVNISVFLIQLKHFDLLLNNLVLFNNIFYKSVKFVFINRILKKYIFTVF